jgi:hypothetical protein
MSKDDAENKKILEDLKTKPRAYSIYLIGGVVQWLGGYIAASCRKKDSREIGLGLLGSLHTGLMLLHNKEDPRASLKECAEVLELCAGQFTEAKDKEMADAFTGMAGALNEAIEYAGRAVDK